MARRILVVGGGYAGLLFVNRLARKTRAADVEIVLASARPWFVERVRLHEDVAGHGPARRALASLVDPRVSVRIGTVEAVDLGSAQLRERGGRAFVACRARRPRAGRACGGGGRRADRHRARDRARRASLVSDQEPLLVWINGEPGLVFRDERGTHSALTLSFEGDAITDVWIVNNPHKLAHLAPRGT